ncbi:cation-translocating P-type ATPase [Aquabacterium sp.]|uniref:cation-translocating P-type ATPase n=1 Tax=Aquabacterium sp. TaxID=1872578 RepID=UPI0026362CA7|nr:cation-translocating P-type ATPase [Aquabacterium sp.]MDD2976157.1 cation-translocating P-type ATPase [Aquabacterium sp.]
MTSWPSGDEGGLSEQRASELLRTHGPNELPQARRRSVWRIAAEVVREPMLQLLIAAGLIYLVLGDVAEALALLAFVLLSLSISLVQETRTERVMAALRDLSSPRALVIRDGRRRRVAGREVVPGDLIVLAEGDRIPADAVLRAAHALQTDESLLTGESVPVRKQAAPGGPVADQPPGGDDLPWVFSGALVVRGQGLAEVRHTGAATQIGRIGQALSQIDATPSALQRQTRQWVRAFAVVGVALSVAVALLYAQVRGDVLGGVLAGITLAMSMLPQEFPLILTVFMAMGAWRIASQRVLVRRASAIETLGTATVLCTDKTGTLTQNRMTVAALQAGDASWTTDAAGSAPLPEAFHAVLEYAILASERDPFDPMEQAFWDLARSHLTEQDREHLHPDWTLAHAYALSPDLLAMSHVWQSPAQRSPVVAAKGSPEAVADLCHLPPERVDEIRRQTEALAAQGLRVLGVARGGLDGHQPGADWPAIQHDLDFEFLGLVGLMDPLRPAVAEAVQLCRQAGIRVAMITGDYPATALAIAAQAGIDTQGGALRGEEIAALSEAALGERVRQTQVFARVTPEQKWRIVRALQAHGEVVAMTGDGVNDAPSLKAADIGVAMGARGTDVAREAASLVLLDDDFGAIPQAVRLGRRIDDNLRKGMAFVLAVHVPIAGLSLLPLLFGLPLLFMPVHIAFLELIIDPVCSVVFEAEPEEADVMRRPPRRPGTPLLGRDLLLGSLVQGLLVMGLIGGFYVWLLSAGTADAAARTAAFVALVGSNVALIVSNRSLDNRLLASLRRPNRALWVMLGVTTALLTLVLAWPVLRALFQFQPLTGGQAAQAGAVALGALALLEALKWVRARAGTAAPA